MNETTTESHPIDIHPQDELEANLGFGETEQQEDALSEDGYAIISASGFAIISASGFAII